MRIIIIISFLFLSCSDNKTTEKEASKTQKTETVNDRLIPEIDHPEEDTTPPRIYSNKRFRNVTVTPQANNTYRITGEGQIFEASFGWVVEDGHNELLKGHEMTNAGAPEWGRFDFTVTIKKQDPNTVLHLVIFETSAMDGSRQYELPLLLG